MKTEERTYKEKVRKERREKAGTISDKDKTLKIDGSWMIMRNGSEKRGISERGERQITAFLVQL